MNRLLAIIRGSLHTIAYAVVALVVIGYLAIHFNLVGMMIGNSLEDKLAEQIGARVTVDGDIEVDWLNQVVLNQLTIYDQQDDTLIYARRAMVAYDLWPLLQHHLVLNTCQLIDFDIRTYRASADSAANYQFLVDALSSNDTGKQPFIERLDLNAILLRQGQLRYDVLDKPRMTDTPIDPNHIDIRRLSANVHVHDKQLTIKKFHCMESDSHLQADRCEVALDMGNRLKEPEGKNLFLADLKGLELNSEMLNLQADIHGTTDELRLKIRQAELPHGHPAVPAIGNAEMRSDLRVKYYRRPMDSIYVMADVERLQLTLDKVGPVRLNGTLEGMPCQSALTCHVESNQGAADVQADVTCPRPESGETAWTRRNILVEGTCKTGGFELGELLPARYELGKVALDMDFGLRHRPNRPMELALRGTFGQLEWRGHNYRDIQVDGEGQTRRMRGTVALRDTLGNVEADFDIDLTQPQHHYKVDGRLEHLNPNAMRLTQVKNLEGLTVSSHVHADLLANGWREAEGEMKLTNLYLEKGDRRLDLEPVLFEGTANRGRLTSPVAHVDYEQLPQTGGYHLKGRVPMANELFEILDVPVAMNRFGSFDLQIDSARRITQALIDLPALDLQQGRALAATLDMRSDETGWMHPVLDFEALTEKHRLTGTLKGRVRLEPLDVELTPTTLLFNNEEVQLSDAHLHRTPEGDLLVENLQLKSAQQEISAQGILGNEGDKELRLSLKRFDLGQIFSNFKHDYLHLGGLASGDIRLNSEPQLHLQTDSLLVEDFAYIDTVVGDARLNLDFILPTKRILASADVTTDGTYHSHIDADIKLANHDTLDLIVYPDHFPIGFINCWTGNILQHLSGRITGGPVHLFGDAKLLELEGHSLADVRFTHNLLGAHFHLCDTVRMDHNLIHLENAYVDDCHGHPLTLNARITHQNLTRFGYDVTADMPDANQGFLALDRGPGPGRIYWGQLYAQGHAHLKGGNGKHRINVNVGTTDRSWFYLSPGEEEINPDQAAYSFLTFRDKRQLAEAEAMRQAAERQGGLDVDTPDKPSAAKKEDKTDLQVDLQVNVSNQCQLTVQMDPLSDDRLTARGHGNLSVRYDPRRDITLAGTYHVNQGTYTMNVKGDLVSKVFQLQNTSFVRFNGVPREAELALDCRYNIPSVNLTDLDESITTLGSLSRSSVPVDCNLNITGPLSSPQIRFDLEVKNVSDEIQAYVHNVIGTQEMLNQEVLYLLLFSKFYTPQYAQSTQSRTGSELTSLASASITSQLNQLLSHVSNNFTMGTNFRSDKGDFTDMEMDLSLSTRLLGDRLLLNGNVGYRDPANRIGLGGTGNSFIGDFDMEVLINNSGTMRAKAYSHYNERDYSINNALSTQGIGFILRRDFNGLNDLWPWRKKKEQPAETEPATADSTRNGGEMPK